MSIVFDLRLPSDCARHIQSYSRVRLGSIRAQMASPRFEKRFGFESGLAFEPDNVHEPCTHESMPQCQWPCCRRHRVRAHTRRPALAASSERSALRRFQYSAANLVTFSARFGWGSARVLCRRAESIGQETCWKPQHLGSANRCEDGRSRRVRRGTCPASLINISGAESIVCERSGGGGGSCTAWGEAAG